MTFAEFVSTPQALAVACARCGHTAFIHSEGGEHRCLYSECECARYFPGDLVDVPLPAEGRRGPRIAGSWGGRDVREI